jgi:pimeloyl-ACP methyl ester carboxylesterase
MGTEWVQVGRQRLRVRRSGRGTPLLLIMGLGGCIESWEPLRRRLTGYELILVDHPGMGHSPAPAAPIPMPGLARLYDDLIDVLGYGQVDVLGYSFGGTVAQQLAIQHPRRIGRLVLAATACGWGGVPLTFPAMIASASPMRYYSQAFRDSVAPYLYAGRTGREPARYAGATMPRPSLQGLMWQLAAYSTWTSLPWLHLLGQPVLVLAGEEDPMAPVQNSVILANRIPNATLHILPRAGHLFLFDETTTVVPIVKGFLSGAPTAEAV